jgi:UDP-2,3-diacylglucosamine hydrolase
LGSIIAAWEGEALRFAPSKGDWIFISDVHLTGKEPGEVEAFLRFLNSEKERMAHLVILGDLFEFFFGFKKFFSTGKSFAFADYLPVFEKLQSLNRQGIQIKYFEGNHDFFLHPFFAEQFNMDVEVYSNGTEERLGKKRTFIAHGDLSNPKQWGYRAFRRVLKNRWTYHLIQLAGPQLSRWVAFKLAENSYQKYHNKGQSLSPSFRTFAHQKFLEGFEIVILGHSHFPEKFEEWIEGKRCLYFNVGDWLVHRSFLRFTPPEHFELERYIEGIRR